MGHITILLADDEPHVTHIMARAVRAAGMEALTAEDGEEAYELAAAHRPSLIVTDLQMPYMSGIDLATKLNGNNELRTIPVILLSARGYVVEREAQQLENIRLVVEKPFSARDVVARIRDLLGEGGSELRRSA